MRSLTLILITILLTVSVALGQGAGTAASIYRTTFANLGTPVDGSVRYVTDGTAGAPCTGGGTGAYAFRTAGVWNCSATFAGGGGAPGGSNTQVQFNDSSAFGGDAGLVYNKTTDILTIASTGGLAIGTGGEKLVRESANTFGVLDTGGSNYVAWKTWNIYAGTAGAAELMMNLTGSGFQACSTCFMGWSPSNPQAAAPDTGIYRNAAGVLEINNYTAGTFRDLKLRNVFTGDGTAANPALAFTANNNSGLWSNSGNPTITQGGGNAATFFGSGMNTFGVLGFSTDISTAGSVGIGRAADKILRLGDGGANANGWLNTAGKCFLAADQTNATTTFANVNNCTLNVISGRKYSVKASLFLADSTAADGAKLDWNGGAATVTNFRMHCVLVNDTGGVTALTAAASTTLAGVLNAGAMSTANQHEFKCEGTFEPSSSSTFILRMAQNAHSTGTLTLFRGSHVIMEDIP